MQGGRAGRKEPILREDVLLQRMPHMRPRTVEDVDAFAPEYGQDSWHQKHATSEKHEKGAAAVLAYDGDQQVAVLISQRMIGRKQWVVK